MNDDRTSTNNQLPEGEDTDRSIEATRARMIARYEAFDSAVPSELREREEELPLQLARTNASALSKLGGIAVVLDELGQHRTPFVACRRGCSDCCRMNVRISSIEAARIEQHTGRKADRLKASVGHDVTEFLGVDCPFLVNSECSVYAARPLACRSHASFDIDAYWCHPSRAADVEVPQAHFSGALEATVRLVAETKNAVVADIRDFFQSERR